MKSIISIADSIRRILDAIAERTLPAISILAIFALLGIAAGLPDAAPQFDRHLPQVPGGPRGPEPLSENHVLLDLHPEVA